MVMTQLTSTIKPEDAVETLAWLKRIELGEEKVPAGFNWLGLAETAALKANTTEDILWAEVAVLIYRQLAESRINGGESLMVSAMMLRAKAISNVSSGVVPGHFLLDIDLIIRWFCDSLTMSYNEASQKAMNWKNCQISEIRQLRQIKNNLQVISTLANSDKCTLEAELQKWLALRERLP